MFDLLIAGGHFGDMARNRIGADGLGGSDGAQLYFTFTPVITPQGDGSFTIRPGKPVALLKVREVASALRLHISSVYRLIDEGVLPSERPTKGAIRVRSEALEAHRRRMENGEWRMENGKWRLS